MNTYGAGKNVLWRNDEAMKLANLLFQGKWRLFLGQCGVDNVLPISSLDISQLDLL